jgi:hypothetical protein
LITRKERLGFVDGPAISTPGGVALSSRDVDALFHEALEKLYARQSDLFPSTITSVRDIPEKYHVFRSLRRSSDAQAIEAGVSKVDIEVVHRWKVKENSKSGRANLPMHQHYADLTLLLKPFLRYTSKM